MINGTQMKLEDVSDEYKQFMDKFKPKKTTDDCYTPTNIYKAVLDWVADEYDIDPNNIVRPFWPGGNYEREHYPEGCTVVDNPPFSIISQICRRFMENNIKFFLFAPYLTNFSSQARGLTHVIVDSSITYENGAAVNTAFLTNLEPGVEVRSAPELRKRLMEAETENRKERVKELPKYSYPSEVVTASMVGYLSKYGQEIKFRSESCYFIRQLESQKPKGKGIFGSGYLISEKAAAEKVAAEKAAAEKAAAEKWKLSKSELEIIKRLK